VDHRSTEALRVTERFTRCDFGDVVSTIDDPMAYKKPWTFTQPVGLLADAELLELVQGPAAPEREITGASSPGTAGRCHAPVA
jgi:hypothetical protein